MNKNYDREKAHEPQPPITAPPIEGPHSAATCKHGMVEVCEGAPVAVSGWVLTDRCCHSALAVT